MKKKTSTKKILANRQNARHSTGPRTLEGKAKVSKNSGKHLILASPQLLLSTDGERQRYEMLLSRLSEEFQPQSTVQRLDVELLAINLLRQRRLLNYEFTLAEERREALTEGLEQERIMAFHRSQHGGREMESIEDLILDLEEARAAYAAIESAKAFESESLVNFLFMEAIDNGVDVAGILGTEEPFEADRNSKRASSPKVVEALAKKLCKTTDEVWQQLARRIVSELEGIENGLNQRVREMRLVEASSLLADDGATNRIIRYEGHLERQRERLLKRLDRTNKKSAW